MSVDPDQDPAPAGDGAARLLARAGAADARASALLAGTTADLFVPPEARLDDRTRAALQATLAALVGAVERSLRGLLSSAALAPGPALPRLAAAGLTRDPALMRELIARARLDGLAAALPPAGADDPDRASLLPRLSEHADPAIGTAAAALLAADNRRGAGTAETATQTELPAELHYRLVWWVAAALRGDDATLDAALADAAFRTLARHDEGDRPEAAALRLAARLDAAPDTLAAVLVEALGDRRPALFAALIAQALRVPFEAAREIVADAAGDRLWLALRALDLPRDTIARIGLALGEADPRRDLDALADGLDAVETIPVETARAALAPLSLPDEFRAALAALERPR